MKTNGAWMAERRDGKQKGEAKGQREAVNSIDGRETGGRTEW